MPSPVTYLDHAAATPLRPAVADLITEHLADPALTANPSSPHTLGRTARSVLDTSRRTVADLLGAHPAEVIFTSGGTEALWRAIVGVALAGQHRRLLVSPLCHSAVWSAVSYLALHHRVESHPIPLTPTGQWALSALTPDFLQSFDAIIGESLCSETSIAQPVADLCQLVTALGPVGQRPVTIIDPCAAVVSQPVDHATLPADIIALSAEKFGGLGGSGVLVVQSGTPLKPLGPSTHEWGLRPGTQSLLGARTLALALSELTTHRPQEVTRYQQLTHALRDLRDQLGVPASPWATPQSPSHITHWVLPRTTGQIITTQLDLRGVCAATGPACSSGAAQGSRALAALGLPDTATHRGLRFSFGHTSTLADITALQSALQDLTL